MSSLLNKAIVLVLNANWQRLPYVTVKDAIVKLTGGITTVPARVVDLVKREDGSISPGMTYSWDEWVKLPVGPEHLALQTSFGPIRCPLVVVEPNYNQMRYKSPRLSTQGVLDRDGYVDQYTGEKLDPKDASVDHVIPKDIWRKKGLKGSPNRWDNLVCTSKKKNFAKGNRMNHQVGYKPLRKPVAPKPLPISSTVSEPKLDEHRPFFPDKRET